MNKILIVTLSAVLALGSVAAVASAEASSKSERMQLRQQARMSALGDPARAAMAQLRWIERIYLRQNQPQAAQTLYRDVLERTQDPALRNFANVRLARLAAWQPRNLDAALAELKRGLDENLAQLR